MQDVPRLSHQDIEAQLGELYRGKRHHHLLAFYGTGEPGTIEAGPAGRFEVVPVRSELELRELLPGLEDLEVRAVFLLPWTRDIPLDIAGRFARRGRVIRIGRDARLRRVFGVAELDAEVLRCPLGDFLLRPGSELRYSAPGGRLTAALWQCL